MMIGVIYGAGERRFLRRTCGWWGSEGFPFSICVCVCACVRACVHACVCMCVCVCEWESVNMLHYLVLLTQSLDLSLVSAARGKVETLHTMVYTEVRYLSACNTAES